MNGPRLLNLAWMATRECPLRCIHCYADSGHRFGVGDLPGSIAKRNILDQAQELGVRQLSITGGDPLARSDFFDLLTHSAKHDYMVTIATSGVLIEEDGADRMRAAGVRNVSVSLDGPLGGINDRIRGAGSFKLIVKGIRLLVKCGLRVSISFTAMKLNYTHVLKMGDLAQDLGAEEVVVRRYVPMGRSSGRVDLDLTGDELQCLYHSMKSGQSAGKAIRSHDPLYHVWSGRMDSFVGRKDVLGGCTAVLASLAIQPDGAVTPCTGIVVPLGNVRTDRIWDIWTQHPTLQRLRIRETLGDPCGQCVYGHVCGGCRASAHNMLGDMFAADPQCCLSSKCDSDRYLGKETDKP